MVYPLLLAGMMLAAPEASLGPLFLNGDLVSAPQGRIFRNVDVTVDGRGQLRLASRRASVECPDANPAPPPVKRYWLVTHRSPGMGAGYDIDVFVNDKWARKLLDVEQAIVLELTDFLHAGSNKIRFVARKIDSMPAGDKKHYFRVLVGSGEDGEEQLVIRKKLLDYGRNASETEMFKDNFSILVE